MLLISLSCCVIDTYLCTADTGNVTDGWNDTVARAVVGNIRIISANITSWNKQGDHVLAWKSDVLALQEVRLNEAAKLGTNIAIGKKATKPYMEKE